MPAAAKPTIKIVRIYISFDHHRPQCVLTDALFVESSSAFAAIFYLQIAGGEKIIAFNLFFQTFPSFIFFFFQFFFLVFYPTKALLSPGVETFKLKFSPFNK